MAVISVGPGVGVKTASPSPALWREVAGSCSRPALFLCPFLPPDSLSRIGDPNALLESGTLLGRGEILPPPYVLVGHSLGGLFVRSFYYSFPDEVGGLVLVDGSHERQFKTWQDLDPSWDPWAPNSGFLRWAAARGAGPRGEAAAFLELQRRGTLPNSRPLTDLPVYVLTADQPDPADTTVSNTEAGRRVWRNLHAELFDGVNQGAHIVTQLSNHNIHLTEPSLVVWAVRRVVTAMRLSGR